MLPARYDDDDDDDEFNSITIFLCKDGLVSF